MGGIFSVVKVREGLAASDYRDPGDYKHPQGTVAYEFKVTQVPRRAEVKRQCSRQRRTSRS
jgi:hypothetical protein